MGNRGKNNARKAKRNKISKASKLAWSSRKQQANGNNYPTGYNNYGYAQD